jgi:hypothetical protein
LGVKEVEKLPLVFIGRQIHCFPHLFALAKWPFHALRFFTVFLTPDLFALDSYPSHPSYICITFYMLGLLLYPEGGGSTFPWSATILHRITSQKTAFMHCHHCESFRSQCMW